MKQNYIVLICLIFISSNTFFGQIVNEGTLQIMADTEVYFGNEYINKLDAIHSNEGDLHLNHNFINNGITTVSTIGTTYFDSVENDVQVISGSTNEINFYNLEVDSRLSGVSVADSFGLFVANKVALTNGSLRLVGESQLIQVNNVANSGAGKLLRDQQGISSTYGYNYWSSPVNTGGIFKFNGGLFDGMDSWKNLFTPKQMLFNSGSPYNGLASIIDGDGNVITASTINERWLYTYSPNNSGYAGWDKIDQNSEISSGVGYSMKGTGANNQNYTYKGTPNNGVYNFTVKEGESVLLGNPYPSAIDAEKFIKDNLTVNEVQFWVDGGSDSHILSNYTGGYSIRNLTGGVAPSVILGIDGLGTATKIIPGQYIAVAQGFFVDAISSGSIVFKNSQRVFVTEDEDSSFLKTTRKGKVNEAATNLLEKSIIRIGYKDPEGFHRQIVLGFIPDSPADINYNPGYDAIMVDPRDDELFFTIDSDLTKKYVIQGVGDFDDLYKIPLGLRMYEEGEHSIMLDAVENFSEAIYVFDKVLNTTHNLNEANFKIELPAGDYLDRFELVFNPVILTEILSVDKLDIQDFKVYYNVDSDIVVKNQNNVEINQVQIYNAIGQQLIQLKGSELQQEDNLIPFNYPKGVYIVIVKSNKGVQSYKVIN